MKKKVIFEEFKFEKVKDGNVVARLQSLVDKPITIYPDCGRAVHIPANGVAVLGYDSEDSAAAETISMGCFEIR